ncbi:hypothetical protein BJX66DRAFT_341878 [Aspergillus keveii]|uniref:Uncharacterized protein n=1 Tax=Aspergillus keveii TaxID=714993 RepID=A0ABR4FU58_9EURO
MPRSQSPLSIPTVTPYTIPTSWAPPLGSHRSGYASLIPDGLKQTGGTVRELLHFNAFVTVIPESNQDAEHSITPEVDDLRTQAELASPGQGEMGKRTYGFWQCPDGFIRWGMGIVSSVAEDVVLVLVEAGPVTQAAAGNRKKEVGREEVETYTRRDPVRGTRPALGFRVDVWIR